MRTRNIHAEQSVFEFDDYKAFVHHKIEVHPGGGRGIRRRLAERMNCQVAYVSHVLAGERHFSLEQAEAVAEFFALRSDETDFLLLLVQVARAGTQGLRKVLLRQMESLRESNRELKNRVKLKGKISSQDQATYYSSWQYQAVRMLLTIPEFRSVSKIANRLSLPLERVHEIIGFMLEKGLIQESSDGYSPTETKIHLGSDSPLIGRLHTNWRMHTIQSLDRKNSNDLHYSGAVTVSKKDYARVREQMTKTILDAHNVISPSKEEQLCVMALDFYEL